ncbi:uncharacterized protein LOC111442979 isoform X3 [Cucurbita moschata]|uniref:Uncharacterized protein LOC111442979 isoform X3 n=1 Tax=Cucurbita moschata TaxID=3662 RepID=A0A6J1FCY8_CUCMO|nr:uncharacterized protein LOC111442979 isoform X3 [Cucurbita moschata]
MTLPRDKFSRGFDGCLDAILASGLLDEDVSHAQLVNLSLPWIIAMARFCKYSHGAISPRRFLRPATEAVPYFEQSDRLWKRYQFQYLRQFAFYLWRCLFGLYKRGCVEDLA